MSYHMAGVSAMYMLIVNVIITTITIITIIIIVTTTTVGQAHTGFWDVNTARPNPKEEQLV